MSLESLEGKLDSFQKDINELKKQYQHSSHMIDKVAPVNSFGVNGNLRLFNGANKKIYVKIGGTWYSTTVT